MKTQALRTWSRILLLLLMTIHIVTWYVLGLHVVGSIGIEALFSGLSRGILNAGFVFWLLIFISVLFFGRAFCGWLCWFGGYLELVEWTIAGKLKIKLSSTTPLYLAAIPFVALFAKVYGALLVNWLNGFPASFTFLLADTEPWGGQQTGLSILITSILYGPTLLFVFGRRAWCRYLCPIGALLKLFDRFSIGKVRLVNDNCLGCGICNHQCDMQVNVMGDLRAYGEVRTSDCIRCLKCVDRCPKGAIGFSLHRNDVVLAPDSAARIEKATLKRRRLSGFDISITIVWIGITVFFTIGGVPGKAPQEIKVLMSAGLLLLVYALVRLVYATWQNFAQIRLSE
jgi:polyferredoxin